MMNGTKEFFHGTAEVNGEIVSFIDGGSGPTLFLMHGIAGNSRSWREQFKGLTSEYRLIAWDAPGYGKSALRNGTLAEYVSTATGLLAALNVERVNILGHSMGGVIAQGIAASEVVKVDKLILSSTFMGHGEAPGKPLQSGYISRLNDIARMPPEEFGRARAKSMLACPPSEQIFKEVAEIASRVKRSGLFSACEVLTYSNTSEFLKGFTKPVLIITGRHDRIILPTRSTDMAAHIANVQHVQFEKSGHAAYLEEPLAYNAAIKKFLSCR